MRYFRGQPMGIMSQRYHPDMSPEAEDAFLAHLKVMDDCYAAAEEDRARNAKEEPEDGDKDDPIRDGWVDKSGRP